MAELNIKLGPHPAIADHPTIPGEKLYRNGEPVGLPGFDQWQSVYLVGENRQDLIGYVLPNKSLQIIRPANSLGGPATVAIIRQEVGSMIGTDGSGGIVPELPDTDDDDSEGDE